MAAAVLTIDINARLANLEEGLKRSNSLLGSFNKSVTSAGDTLKNLFGGVAIAAGVHKFVDLIKTAIDSLDALQDASQKTGISPDILGGIGFAAQQAGSSLESVIPIIGKLNVEIAKAAAGNADAAAVFQRLGISVKDSVTGNVRDAGVVLVDLATKFSTYGDGPNKAAIANELFKKGYQELIPLLNEGGERLKANIEYYRTYAGVTPEATKRADEFNDTLAKVNLLNASFFRQLATELLPALQGYASAMVEAKEKTGAYKSTAEETAVVLQTLAEWALRAGVEFHQLGIVIGGRLAQLEALSHFDFKRAGNIGDLLKGDVDAAYKRLDDFLNRVKNPIAGPDRPKPTGNAPGLPPKGDDSARKALDAQIRAFEDAIKDERQILNDREHFLQAFYQDGEIGIREYFDTRLSIIQAGLAKELAAYDGEIAALRRFAAAAVKPEDRIKAESDIAEAIRRRANAEQAAAKQGTDLFIEERRAVQQFRDAIEETAIQLTALQGNTADAAAAQFDRATRAQREQLRLNSQSNDPELVREAIIGQRLYDQLRARTVQQAQLNQAQSDFGLILDQVGNAQARIDIGRNSGALTELEALRQQGDANAARIADLRKVADAYQAIADAIGDPRAQTAADQLRVKIEQLAGATDLVAKKFNDVFIGSVSDALVALTEKGAKLSDVIKNLEKSLVQGIAKIAAQNLAETLFKPGGPLGGIGKVLGGIFGGKSVGDTASASALTGSATALTASSTALDTSSLTLTTAGTSLTAAAGLLSGAAAALSAASAASAVSGVGGGLSGIFGSALEGLAQGGGLAGGTDFWRGGPTWVGERGPEVVNLPRGAQVIPNHVLAGKRASKAATVQHNTSINITVPGGTSTKTANQIAVEVQRAMRRAAARDS